MSKRKRLKVLRGMIGLKTASSVPNLFVSEHLIQGLVHYLNRARTPKEKRVLRILRQMHELENLRPPVFTEQIEGSHLVWEHGVSVLNPLYEKVAPEKYRTQIEIDRQKAMLNGELARYRFTPFVSTGLPYVWVVTWRIASQRRQQDESTVLQAEMLELILNLARSRYLDRLRKCARCKQWLFAKTGHQTYCSKKCQQENYTKTEEFRAHRRVYARNRYHELMPSRRSRERTPQKAGRR